MTLTLIFLLIAVLLSALLWLLFGGQRRRNLAQSALEINELLPVHCKRFPQMQNVFNSGDQAFIAQRAPDKVAKKWRAERREITQLYIRGLREDFQHLEKLARLLAALSPTTRRNQEWEWLRLSLEFRLLYVATQLRFAIKFQTAGELVRLAEMLTALRLTLESTLNDLTKIRPEIQETIAS